MFQLCIQFRQCFANFARLLWVLDAHCTLWFLFWHFFGWGFHFLLEAIFNLTWTDTSLQLFLYVTSSYLACNHAWFILSLELKQRSALVGNRWNITERQALIFKYLNIQEATQRDDWPMTALLTEWRHLYYLCATVHNQPGTTQIDALVVTEWRGLVGTLVVPICVGRGGRWCWISGSDLWWFLITDDEDTKRWLTNHVLVLHADKTNEESLVSASKCFCLTPA